MYNKNRPNISYEKFLVEVNKVKEFQSIEASYSVVSIKDDWMKFTRESGSLSAMDLRKVHQAYIELEDFKTRNFKPYVPRKHSPALGLLMTTGLLEINI